MILKHLTAKIRQSLRFIPLKLKRLTNVECKFCFWNKGNRKITELHNLLDKLCDKIKNTVPTKS